MLRKAKYETLINLVTNTWEGMARLKKNVVGVEVEQIEKSGEGKFW